MLKSLALLPFLPLVVQGTSLQDKINADKVKVKGEDFSLDPAKKYAASEVVFDVVRARENAKNENEQGLIEFFNGNDKVFEIAIEPGGFGTMFSPGSLNNPACLPTSYDYEYNNLKYVLAEKEGVYPINDYYHVDGVSIPGTNNCIFNNFKVNDVLTDFLIFAVDDADDISYPQYKHAKDNNVMKVYNNPIFDTFTLEEFDDSKKDCIANWDDCSKDTCKQTFTVSQQPENGGAACAATDGDIRPCTCPTVTASDISALTNKDDYVVARFNTLRGKAALQGLDAAIFAKVAEFDLLDLSTAPQKKEALLTLATLAAQPMKLKIGTKAYDGAQVRSQDKGAAVDFDNLGDEDRLTPQQPQVFVIANNYPQFVTVKRTNKVLVWKIENEGYQPEAQPGTRRFLLHDSASQDDCDATIIATNEDGVVYVSENVTPGCYYDTVLDKVLVCPVGHYCDGIVKTPCEKDTYASSTGETSCHNVLPDTEYAVGTGNTNKGDCATRTVDLQNCGCCTGCADCAGVGEGVADVMSAVELACGGTCS